MTTKEINDVLEKYWACETTLEEESMLREYFAGNVAEQFQSYRDYFLAIRLQSNVSSDLILPSGNIEKANIERLLNKYWDCSSSLSDEQTLKEYFNGSEIDSDFIQFKDLFNAFSAESNVVGGELKSDNIEQAPSGTPAKVFQLSKRWIAVAASLFIGMMVWFNSDAIVGLDPGHVDSGSYATLSQEEKEAYDVTMEALAFLSGKLDKSSSTIKNDIIKVANANILK